MASRAKIRSMTIPFPVPCESVPLTDTRFDETAGSVARNGLAPCCMAQQHLIAWGHLAVVGRGTVCCMAGGRLV